MPSLHDQLFAPAWGVLTDFHGESVQVQTAADSEPRTITAICKIDAEFGNVSFAGDGENETLSIGCSRDATTGIAAADVTKTKAWYGEDARPFSFTGQKTNVRPDRWTLMFRRKRQTRQGAREQ